MAEIDMVEELEPLDALDAEGLEDSGEPKDFSLYGESIFPILVLNREMRIVYANGACKNLFGEFFGADWQFFTGSYFTDVFGKAFELEDLREIRETIREGKNGCSWKGAVKIKSRDIVSVQTKVYLFSAEPEEREPRYYVVMFDDVTEEKKGLLRSVFLSLLEASKLKDNDTGKHIIRVNYYSKRLAEELFRSGNPRYTRIDADWIDTIGFLAAMHDVGKIGIPDDILNKKGPLSEWEWGVMRQHTINGGFILSTYPNPMAKDIALCHHERWDGKGYPYQLEAETIPLAARIVMIADVYDALRMQRSYKAALSHEAAASMVLSEGGTHFDPSLIEFFTPIHQEFDRIYEENKDILEPSTEPHLRSDGQSPEFLVQGEGSPLAKAK